MQAVEGGVLVVVDLADLHAQIAQQAGQVVAAGAVERVHHHAQAGSADGLRVHALLERGQVRGDQVHRLEFAAGDGRLRQQGSFHTVGELGRRSAAVHHAQLHAQVLGRVVAAREHDAAHRVIILRDRPAQAGRGAVVLRQLHREPVRGGHFGGQLGVAVRVLTAVMADDQGVLARQLRIGIAVFLEHARGGVHRTRQRFLREVLTNDGAPSVRAEMNVSHDVPFSSGAAFPPRPALRRLRGLFKRRYYTAPRTPERKGRLRAAAFA